MSVPVAISDSVRRPYSEALEIVAAPGGAVIACERCHHVLCGATENYKAYTRQRATPVSDLPRGTDPARYGMTDTAELRQYFCPACAVQFETEIAKTGDPSLHAVELDVAALQMDG
jgi:acetone carboxylase gamma subunit